MHTAKELQDLMTFGNLGSIQKLFKYQYFPKYLYMLSI